MGDDADKLPAKPDKEHLSAFSPGQFHPISDPTDFSTNLFSRFVQKVGLIFNPTAPVGDIKLSGRIRDLQTIANSVLFELLDFKEAVKERVHPELYALILPIIDPLIKEIGRTPPIVEKKDNTAQQVKMFSRYVDSIEKAKDWSELCKAASNKEDLEKAIIQQTAKEFISRIDRDVQVLQDYLGHALNSLDLSTGLKSELKEKLMPEISPKIQDLLKLKTLPTDFSLNSFIQWRSCADQSREIIFGEALHIIDIFSDDYLPSPKKESESEQLTLINEQLKVLEEEISKLTVDIKINEEWDDAHRKVYLAAIEKLEGIAHQLNGNLHLPSEDCERLDIYFEVLLKLREELF